jgi:hypothetical protein
LLISFNVKLAWSSIWRSLMVNPRPISSPILLYQAHLDYIQTCWLLGCTTPETFNKIDSVVYWSLMDTTESWIHHIDSPM